MKYVILFAVGVSSYSFIRCYPVLSGRETAEALQTLYCNVGFFSYTSNSYIFVSFLIHLLIWFAVGLIGYSFYSKYLRGRFP